MADPTAQEVLMMELLNRARLDPAGEATRYGIDLNEGLAPGTISASSKQPLAWSVPLSDAADAHSQAMIDSDFFAHVNPNTGSTPQSRANAAGYTGQVGENIAFRGSTGSIDATSMIVLEHQDLFVDSGIAGRGHRLNILSNDYQQAGVGQALGVFVSQGTAYNASMVTQDFGIPPAAGQFITGVAYNDSDANAFYSVGEGRGAISVTTSSGTFATRSAGDYSGAISSGLQTVTFSGGNLGSPVSLGATIVAGRNAKIDLVGQSTIVTSTSITENNGISTIIGLGTFDLTLVGDGSADSIFGSAGNDQLVGGGGADHLAGGKGNDTYSVDDSGDVATENANAGTDLVQATASSFTLSSNVENLTFVNGGTHTGTGNALANVMTGNTGNDTFFADDGLDTLIGGDGNDILVAHRDDGPTHIGLFAQDADNLSGGIGNDTLYGDGFDTLNGGDGFDVLQVINGYNVTLDLVAAGIEYVVSEFGSDSYTATAATSTIEVYGSGGNDTITGGSGHDNLWGGVGNDMLTGNNGDDLLVGDLGADSLSGGAGSDRLYIDPDDTFIDGGGGGFDIAYIATGSGMTLNMATTNLDWVADFAGGNDIIDASGTTTAVEIYGAGGTDTLSGGSGNDRIFAGSGTDTLTGNAGSDVLVGEGGVDRLIGGIGNDVLYGGTEFDTFVWTTGGNTDTVLDWQDGTDKLEFSGVAGLDDAGDLTITSNGAHTEVFFGAQRLFVVANAAGQIDSGDLIFT